MFKIFAGVSKIWALPQTPFRPTNLRRTPPPPDHPNFALLSLARHILESFSWGPGPSSVHVWALGLSCETRFWISGDSTWVDADFGLRASPLKTPPKFHEKTPKRVKKERKLWREGEKKSAKFWEHPPFEAPTLRRHVGLKRHWPKQGKRREKKRKGRNKRKKKVEEK